MIGGFIALITFLVLVSFGLTAVPVILLVVLLVSMAITALYGWTVERIAYRPLRHSFRLAPMLSAIGMETIKAGEWDTVLGKLSFDAKGDIKVIDYVVYKWDAKGNYAEINPKGS